MPKILLICLFLYYTYTHLGERFFSLRETYTHLGEPFFPPFSSFFVFLSSRLLGFRMSTNRDLFSDLHSRGSNPTSSNLNYTHDVQAWLWDHLNCEKQCLVVGEWVTYTSTIFSNYAKILYPKSGYSARNILSGTKHRSWLETVIEFPTVAADCPCLVCQPVEARSLSKTKINLADKIHKETFH